MARVHTLGFAADDFAGLYVPGSAADDQWVSQGESKAGSWKEPEARWERETGRPLADLCMILDIALFTTEAYEALAPMLDGRGEALPLRVTDAPPDAVAFNVTRVVDALDQERSEVKRFSSGRVMRVPRPVFVPERIEGETIFRETTYPRSLYVTGEFLQAAEAIGLQGMRLSEDWTGEPEPQDDLVAHHIIPPLDLPSDSLQRAQAHAQKLGIDPDEAANGVALPRARHEGAYRDAYFDALWERFREADDRDSGVAVLQRIGQELAAGEFP